jgi:serine/threonine protein kinase
MTEGHTERLEAALAGRYKVERKLGEGGMASVYLAEDLKHRRKVALKVLLPELAAVLGGDRFLSEIQTTAQLQHPHILPLFDSGTADGYLYYVMPYIDGETLREKLDREKQLGVEESVRIARDVADALQYAHRQGVIHRDIKPANILLQDGRPVVADFGIALAVSAAGGGRMTETGLSLGTPHYMSPEQASADRELSARSDVYSLGCVLYEMLAGQPPHTGPSAQSILVHILTEEPRPLTDLRQAVPPNVAATVAKAIEKLPADRFATATEFMEALGDEGFRHRASVHAPRAASNRVWASVAGVSVMIAVAAVWFALRQPSMAPAPSTASLQAVPLTSFEGDERDPAFSPDGNQVAFSWGPEGGITNTYIKLVGPGDPIRLTNSPYSERQSQWSPDGRWICFSRDAPTGRVIILVPALGGPERNLGSTSLRCSWSPDSQYVLTGDAGSLWLVPISGGDRRLVNLPDIEGDGAPMGVISPDARLMAVRRGGGMYVVPLDSDYQPDGTPRSLAPADWGLVSWSWTPDSQSLIAVRDINNGNLGGDTGMYRFRVAGGEPERLAFAGDNPWYLDVARMGRRLAFTRLRRDVNLYRAELGPDGMLSGEAEPVAVSSRREFRADLSPDGSRIAFSSTRSVSDEIWVSDLDGANAVQLTASAAPDGTYWPTWSPDGTRIAYQARPEGAASAPDIFVVPAAGGAAVRLTDAPEYDGRPTWSADGEWIYFASDREGGRAGWKVPAAGGPATRVTDVSAAVYRESPDGRWLFAGAGQQQTRIDLSDGEATVVLRDQISDAAMTSRGLYYLSPSTDLQSSTLRLLPLDGSEPRTLGVIPHTTSGGLSVSPDFRFIVYSQCDQCAADIMLVEGFQ